MVHTSACLAESKAWNATADQDWSEWSDTDGCLTPVADMLNHRAGAANAKWGPPPLLESLYGGGAALEAGGEGGATGDGGAAFAIRSRVAIAAGAEIVISYGERSNEDLVRVYAPIALCFDIAFRHVEGHGSFRHVEGHGSFRHVEGHGSFRNVEWHGSIRHVEGHGSIRHVEGHGLSGVIPTSWVCLNTSLHTCLMSTKHMSNRMSKRNVEADVKHESKIGLRQV